MLKQDMVWHDLFLFRMMIIEMEDLLSLFCNCCMSFKVYLTLSYLLNSNLQNNCFVCLSEQGICKSKPFTMTRKLRSWYVCSTNKKMLPTAHALRVDFYNATFLPFSKYDVLIKKIYNFQTKIIFPQKMYFFHVFNWNWQ